jgi:hypothetical protein
MLWYEKYGINGLINKYCEWNIRTKSYMSKDNINITELYTVSYLLYVNGFYSHLSDNIIKVSYKKISDNR